MSPEEDRAVVRDHYRIVKNEPVTEGVFELILDAPDIARAAAPGQFVNVYLPDGAMLLPRPISIAGADKNTGELSLIYAVVGAGTQALSLLRAASDFAPNTIEMMGPLGTGFFDYPGGLLIREGASKTRRVILIGGGAGIPPLLFAAQKLRGIYGADVAIAAFLGYRKDPWLDERFGRICDEVHTISGPATVVDLLDGSRVGARDDRVGARDDRGGARDDSGGARDDRGGARDDSGGARDDGGTFAREDDVLALSCGPRPMLAAVSAWCVQNSISLRVSLEERMGCGYGACAGCTAKTRPLNDPEKPQNGPNNPGPDGIIKKKVCVHGPVFWAEEVVW
ncbi:MAG: hypothetical protein LBN12_08400 [Clostridiales Family XIII bacterium]|nr:hypothetical protein [Clostridiales Family XIII bacterium]